MVLFPKSDFISNPIDRWVPLFQPWHSQDDFMSRQVGNSQLNFLHMVIDMQVGRNHFITQSLLTICEINLNSFNRLDLQPQSLQYMLGYEISGRTQINQDMNQSLINHSIESKESGAKAMHID